jgi:hypothetical protein
MMAQVIVKHHDICSLLYALDSTQSWFSDWDRSCQTVPSLVGWNFSTHGCVKETLVRPVSFLRCIVFGVILFNLCAHLKPARLAGRNQASRPVLSGTCCISFDEAPNKICRTLTTGAPRMLAETACFSHLLRLELTTVPCFRHLALFIYCEKVKRLATHSQTFRQD